MIDFAKIELAQRRIQIEIENMLKKLDYVKNIKFKLSYLKACISTLNSSGFFDLNIVAEDFFAALLNEVYGYSLQNLNHTDMNAAAIDLGDPASRIGIQVTSQRNKSKIQKTVDKFVKHGLEKDYDQLKIFIIGKRTGRYENLAVPATVNFSGESDVIDIPSLMKDIRSLDDLALQKVWSLVREKTYQYPGFLDSRSPLDELQKRSTEDLARQRKCIGQSHEICRTRLLDSIAGCLNSETSARAILVGDSGCGKSAVASRLGEHPGNAEEDIGFLFLSLSSIIQLSELDLSPDSSFELSAALSQIRGSEALIVINGVDGAQTKQQQRALAKFICEIDGHDNLKLILTCQNEHLSRLQTRLLRINCDTTQFTQLPVFPFNNEELREVLLAFPNLNQILNRPKLPTLYRRPFVIDALVQASGQPSFNDQEIGESHLIEWFWDQHIAEEAGTKVSKALIELAKCQGDNSDAFSYDSQIEDGDAIDLAIQHSFLVRSNGAVKFSHDMYADWARSRFLLEKGEGLPDAMAKRAANPIWHRAIRLVAIHLLEHDQVAQWKKHVVEATAAQGLILDGVLFGAEPLSLLVNSMDVLLENEGELLSQLLKRASVVITVPGYIIEKQESAGEVVSPHLMAVHRDPKPYCHQYGALLLIFLVCIKQSDDVKKAVSHDASNAAKLWLEMTPESWPYRDQAAEIAIILARDVAKEDWREDDEPMVDAFKGLLYAFQQKPEAVRPMLLELSGLDGDCEKAKKEIGKQSKDGVQIEETDLAHWQQGPLYRPNAAFRKACFAGDALWPVASHDSEFARRIVLALLLKRASCAFRTPSYSMPYSSPECGLVRAHIAFGPTHYLHGPYLRFLQSNLLEGSRLIVDIANAASWQYVRTKPSNDGGRVLGNVKSPIDSEVDWFGDENSHCWNRGYLGGCDQIVPALSALEKVLGDKIEAGEDVDEVIGDVLARCRSVSIAGVLFDIGRRHPKLFESVLRPLLTCPVLLIWSETLSKNTAQARFGGPSTEWGDWFFEEHKAWLFAEYRTRSILQIASQQIDENDLLWSEVTKPLKEYIESENTGLFDVLTDVAGNRQPYDAIDNHLRAEKKVGLDESNAADDPALETANLGWGIYRLLAHQQRATKESLEQYQPVALNQITDDCPNVLALRRNNWLGERLFLLHQHRDWLKEQGMDKQFLDDVVCWQRFQLPIVPEDVLAIDYVPVFDVFAASLAIDRFAEDTSDSAIRKWLARLITEGNSRVHYRIVALAWKHRVELKDWFPRIVRLALWSGCAIFESERHDIIGLNPNPNFDRESWQADAIKTFADETLPPTIPSFDELFLSAPRIRYDNNRRYYRHAGKKVDIYFKLQPIDSRILSGILNAIPVSADLEDVTESLTVRLGVVRFFLDIQLRMIESFNQQGEPLSLPNDKHPSMFGQREIIARIAAEMCVLSPEDSRILWEPIFALGVTSPEWINALMTKWLWPKLCQPGLSGNLAATWQAVIDFVCQHPNWQIDVGGKPWESPLHEVLAMVIGVDKSFYNLWDKASSTYIEIVKSDSFVFILQRVVQCKESASPAIRWISNHQGQAFQLDAIGWINDSELEIESLSQDSKLANAVSELLGVVFRDRENELIGDAREQFNKLLAKTVRTLNPVALDVNQRIAGL